MKIRWIRTATFSLNLYFLLLSFYIFTHTYKWQNFWSRRRNEKDAGFRNGKWEKEIYRFARRNDRKWQKPVSQSVRMSWNATHQMRWHHLHNGNMLGFDLLFTEDRPTDRPTKVAYFPLELWHSLLNWAKHSCTPLFKICEALIRNWKREKRRRKYEPKNTFAVNSVASCLEYTQITVFFLTNR